MNRTYTSLQSAQSLFFDGEHTILSKLSVLQNFTKMVGIDHVFMSIGDRLSSGSTPSKVELSCIQVVDTLPEEFHRDLRRLKSKMSCSPPVYHASIDGGAFLWNDIHLPEHPATREQMPLWEKHRLNIGLSYSFHEMGLLDGQMHCGLHLVTQSLSATELGNMHRLYQDSLKEITKSCYIAIRHQCLEHHFAFSKTEKHILELYCQLRDAPQVAEKKGQTPRAVQRILQQIRQRLGAADNDHAVRIAGCYGLIE